MDLNFEEDQKVNLAMIQILFFLGTVIIKAWVSTSVDGRETSQVFPVMLILRIFHRDSSSIETLKLRLVNCI